MSIPTNKGYLNGLTLNNYNLLFKERVKFLNPEIVGGWTKLNTMAQISSSVEKIGKSIEGMATKKAQLKSILSQIFTDRHFIKI